MAPFDTLHLDTQTATPLYRQLAVQLAERIDAGQWRAGEALPSERTLAQMLGISRVTARKALAMLVEQGLIRRSHGAGNFIAPRLNQPLTRLTSFTEMLAQRGFTPRSRWLIRRYMVPDAEQLMRLALAPGAQVAYLKRQRLADDTVMAVEESCLPSSLVPEPQAVGDSLYRYLELQGHVMTRALQHVTAVNAEGELAALAGVPERQAMLKITRLGYLEDGRPGELTVTYCRTDYYDFMVELTR